MYYSAATVRTLVVDQLRPILFEFGPGRVIRFGGRHYQAMRWLSRLGRV